MEPCTTALGTICLYTEQQYPKIDSPLSPEFKRDLKSLFLTPFKNATNNVS